MTAEEKRANSIRLLQMKGLSDFFYGQAVQIGVHQFLEVNGFLVELVKMYCAAHDRGEDIVTEPLKAMPYEMAYIADKIDCIFGDALADPANREAFLNALAEKGGWNR